MTKIVIAGAGGRMGHVLTRCAQGIDNIDVVGAVERADHPDMGKDAGLIAGIPETGISLSADLAAVLPNCDVLVDFTLHTAAPQNAKAAAEAGCAMVIGATGLSDKETAVVAKAAESVPIVWAPNMSLGVNLLFAVVRKAASVFGNGYGVEIDETHHVHKKDAPSGTALRLGEKVADGLNTDFSSVYVHDEGGRDDVHDPGRIVIRSHREGEVVGKHTVSFENEGEKVEFTHNARNRDAFAMGALRAAQWVVGRKPRIYDMQDVLDL